MWFHYPSWKYKSKSSVRTHRKEKSSNYWPGQGQKELLVGKLVSTATKKNSMKDAQEAKSRSITWSTVPLVDMYLMGMETAC